MKAILATVALAMFCTAALSAPPPPASTLSVAEARSHYLVGEKAFNHQDYRTAVLEWRKALRLKPDSAYTAKMLAKAEEKMRALGEPLSEDTPEATATPRILVLRTSADSKLT